MERDFANRPLKQRLQKEKKGPHTCTRLGHSEKKSLLKLLLHSHSINQDKTTRSMKT